MKGLFSLLLAVLLIAAIAVPALAADGDPERDLQLLDEIPADDAPTQTAPDDFYVIDFAGLLSEKEASVLTAMAENVTQQYGCSVHIGILDDMRSFGYYDIEACAEDFFNSLGLGVGPEHTGILLLLSMADRDYDIDAHGSRAHEAFTDYGKTTISDRFLDNFREDDWYGGFYDYIARCEEMLAQADAGDPVDVPAYVTERNTAGGFLVTVLISLLIAWIVCSILSASMKSAKKAVDADRYVDPYEMVFTVRNDHFTHITTSRTKIERSDSGGSGHGGTTVSSGGHSHSSGKF